MSGGPLRPRPRTLGRPRSDAQRVLHSWGGGFREVLESNGVRELDGAVERTPPRGWRMGDDVDVELEGRTREGCRSLIFREGAAGSKNVARAGKDGLSVGY